MKKRDESDTRKKETDAEQRADVLMTRCFVCNGLWVMIWYEITSLGIKYGSTNRAVGETQILKCRTIINMMLMNN